MFKNKSLLLTPVATPQSNEDPSNMSDSRPSLLYDLHWMLQGNVANVAKAVIAYKGATTLFRAIEHIVVTKVK